MKKKPRKLRRRKFLGGLTAAALVAATAPLLSCGSKNGQPVPMGGATVTVYRFQTLKSDSCNACSKHQHYKVFLDAATADANRAHNGCNCRVVAQQMPSSSYDSIASYALGGVIDLRAIYV
jgi:hypothetical protein